MVLRKPIRRILVMIKGKIVSATVKGYHNDDYYIDGKIVQKVRLLFADGSEKYYRLGKTTKTYNVGTELDLYCYKDIYLIKGIKETKVEEIATATEDKKITSLNLKGVAIAFSIVLLLVAIHTISLVHPIDKLKLFIESCNKENRVKLNDLEYNIPDGFKLTFFHNSKSGISYLFSSSNDKHSCDIGIYSGDTEGTKLPVNKCSYYDEDNYYYYHKTDIVINDFPWCYEQKTENNRTSDIYEINDGKHFYKVTLNTYKDLDEKCYNELDKFRRTIRFNK
jgi:hypothetical protein